MNKKYYAQALSGWAEKPVHTSKANEQKIKALFNNAKKSLCLVFSISFFTSYMSPASISFAQTLQKTTPSIVANKENQEIQNKGEEFILTQDDISLALTKILETDIYERYEELESIAIQKQIEIEIEKEREETIFYDIVDSFIVPNWEQDCKSYVISYMDYRATTDRTSAQYQLLNSDRANSDPETGIRMVDGRYAIAVGTGWGFVIGDYIDVVMENGTVIPCIMGEAKSPYETDSNHYYHLYDGSVVEMVIDGTYFSGTSQYPEGLNGTVLELQKVVPN